MHDYIITKTKYDVAEEDSLEKGNGGIHFRSHYPESVLFNGTGVCDGYAAAMYLLLDAAGIENYVVYGKAKGQKEGFGHAWNLVKIGGKFYYLDVTWDDPVPDQGDKVFYDYFNVSAEELRKDHEWDQKACETIISGR